MFGGKDNYSRVNTLSKPKKYKLKKKLFVKKCGGWPEQIQSRKLETKLIKMEG